MPRRIEPQCPALGSLCRHEPQEEAALMVPESTMPTITIAAVDSRVLEGTVTRFVTSYGANWGLITANGTSRKTFFNKRSFIDRDDIATIRIGEMVQFEEETDPVNGTHAINVRRNRPEPAVQP
jgi:cold shock CspA family protein